MKDLKNWQRPKQMVIIRCSNAQTVLFSLALKKNNKKQMVIKFIEITVIIRVVKFLGDVNALFNLDRKRFESEFIEQ